jgi:hypothetical protein
MLGRAIDLSKDLKDRYGQSKTLLADTLGISVGTLNDTLLPVQLCPEARLLMGNRNTGKGAVIGLRVTRILSQMGSDRQIFVIDGLPKSGTVQQQVDYIEKRIDLYSLRPRRPMAVGMPTGGSTPPVFSSPEASYARARNRGGISVNYWLTTSGRACSKAMTPSEFRDFERQGLLMYQTQQGGDGIMPTHIVAWLREAESPREPMRHAA